ncbi:MAG: class I SAM-dependent methyltransferase [Bacteroidota bacterium]
MFKINSANLALYLIEKYKSNWDDGNPDLTTKVTSREHEYEYALLQLHKKTQSGIGERVLNKKVLEIGCGHGGICVYASMNGASSVVGIDLSSEVLDIANSLKSEFETKQLIRKNNIQFIKASTENLPFEDNSFDLIIADNVFEHVEDLDATLKECKRVLVDGGILFAPTFPSILSKAGPHLKYGTKIPWLHVFFTEKAICSALFKRAIKHPELKLFEYYEGLINKPNNFRDVRKYKDLNYITNKKMKDAIKRSGLKLTQFSVHRSLTFKMLFRLFPFLSKTNIDDILSTGSSFKAVKAKSNV